MDCLFTRIALVGTLALSLGTPAFAEQGEYYSTGGQYAGKNPAGMNSLPGQTPVNLNTATDIVRDQMDTISHPTSSWCSAGQDAKTCNRDNRIVIDPAKHPGLQTSGRANIESLDLNEKLYDVERLALAGMAASLAAQGSIGDGTTGALAYLNRTSKGSERAYWMDAYNKETDQANGFSNISKLSALGRRELTEAGANDPGNAPAASENTLTPADSGKVAPTGLPPELIGALANSGMTPEDFMKGVESGEITPQKAAELAAGRPLDELELDAKEFSEGRQIQADTFREPASLKTRDLQAGNISAGPMRDPKELAAGQLREPNPQAENRLGRAQSYADQLAAEDGNAVKLAARSLRAAALEKEPRKSALRDSGAREAGYKTLGILDTGGGKTIVLGENRGAKKREADLPEEIPQEMLEGVDPRHLPGIQAKWQLYRLSEERKRVMAESAPLWNRLRQQGILPSSHGQSLFAMANRHYRQFHRWTAKPQASIAKKAGAKRKTLLANGR